MTRFVLLASVMICCPVLAIATDSSAEETPASGRRGQFRQTRQPLSATTPQGMSIVLDSTAQRLPAA